MNTLEEKLLIYAKNYLNVLLIGRHGVGKTSIVRSVAENLGLKFKYYSTSTLDPFSELVGIPVPDKESKTINFYRPQNLECAEFIFFDELNRVQNPRVLNAVLEIVQFKSINGEKLKNLKMVWAAINPPQEYGNVEDLDPTLEDRFHVYVRMKSEINSEYLETKMDKEIVKVLKDWWETDLNEEQRIVLTPRRIEYIGCMINNHIPWRDTIPIGHTFPVQNLEKKLAVVFDGKVEFILSEDIVINKKEEIIQRLETDPRIIIGVADILGKFNLEKLFECKDILEKLPSELIVNIIQPKFPMKQRQFKQMFDTVSIDVVTQYPRIAKSFSDGVLDS